MVQQKPWAPAHIRSGGQLGGLSAEQHFYQGTSSHNMKSLQAELGTETKNPLPSQCEPGPGSHQDHPTLRKRKEYPGCESLLLATRSKTTGGQESRQLVPLPSLFLTLKQQSFFFCEECGIPGTYSAVAWLAWGRLNWLLEVTPAAPKAMGSSPGPSSPTDTWHPCAMRQPHCLKRSSVAPQYLCISPEYQV